MARSNDTQAMKAKLELQFSNLNQLVTDLGKGLENAAGRLPVAVERGLKQGGIQTQIKAIGAALDKAANPEDFKTIQMALAGAATNAEKIGRALSAALNRRATGAGKADAIPGLFIDQAKVDRATASLHHYADAQRQVAGATQRTTLMSQNMLRVIQDAPFGMLGMANNIQMLAENFSTARAKGYSFTETLKAGLKGLLMGPMAFAAVVAVVTILIQKWDVLAEKAKQLSEMLSGVAEAQRDLNKAFREGTGTEAFQKMLEDAGDETLDKVRGRLESARDAAMGAAGVRNIGEVEDELEKWLATRVGQVGMLTDAQNERVALLNKAKQAEERIQLLYQERFSRLAEDSLRAELGLENRRQDELDALDKKDEQREKKADSERQKTADRLLKQEAEAFAKELELQWAALAGRDDVRQAEIASSEAHEKVFEARQKAKVAAREKLAREMAAADRQVRNILAASSARIAAGDEGARAIGTGVMRPMDSRAGFGEQAGRIDLETMFSRAALGEQIDTRREAADELAMMLADKESKMNDSQRQRLAGHHAKLLAEIANFNAQDEQLVMNAEAKKAELRRQSADQQLASMQSIFGGVSGIMGDMSNIMSEESEKGMKKHRGFMKMAAFADAIAAGIAVYRNTVQAMKGNPLAPVVAGVAMAGVITGLMAKIRQIDNPNGGAGAPVTGGRFTALNSAVTGERTASFQQKQEQIAATSAAQQQNTQQQALAQIANSIKDQRVVIDAPTSAAVSRMGATMNTRRVQTSS